MIDIDKTFVTSDHHFREWTHFGGLLCESSKEQEEEHIALWNSVVGKDDLVLYVGDYSDGIVKDLDELYRVLNGKTPRKRKCWRPKKSEKKGNRK